MQDGTWRDAGPKAPAQHVLHLLAGQAGQLHARDGVRVDVRLDEFPIALGRPRTNLGLVSLEPVGEVHLQRRRSARCKRKLAAPGSSLQLDQKSLSLLRRPGGTLGNVLGQALAPTLGIAVGNPRHPAAVRVLVGGAGIVGARPKGEPMVLSRLVRLRAISRQLPPEF